MSPKQLESTSLPQLGRNAVLSLSAPNNVNVVNPSSHRPRLPLSTTPGGHFLSFCPAPAQQSLASRSSLSRTTTISYAP